MRKLFLPLLSLFALTLASCEDEIGNLGAPYFSDTVSVTTKLDTLTANTPGVTVSNYTLAAVPTPGLAYNANFANTALFVGKAENGALEAWGVLRFPTIGDTLSNVTKVRLLLKVIPYRHGDQTTNADLAVYVEGGGKVTESTTDLAKGDLSATPFGTFQGDLPDTSFHALNIDLDASIKTQLSAPSLAFVIVPNTLTNVRAFGSNEVSDSKFQPQLEYTYVMNGETKVTYRKPVLDYTIIKRNRTQTADQLFIAGGTNDRVMIKLDKSYLNIDPHAAINTAVLRMKLDPSQSSLGANPKDSTPPAIVLKGMNEQNDTLTTLMAYGTQTDANTHTYEFQLRDLIEYWLAHSDKNFGFELRAGYAGRRALGNLFFTEDYTLNRWTFYGPSSAPENRPQLIITSSNLK